MRLIEDRLIYPHLGTPVGVRVHFNCPGYAPLSQLVDVLQQARVIVKEMSVEPGEETNDTIHLFLKLPRGLDSAKLSALIADLKEVQTVSVE